ncbi:ABC transporter substrate-binding protein [Streptomyces sp. NEAU-YJ-81]|uniref:ABC transporter substrate-binding protein n=1 Tax=Streptomyces sp. NEAU-YJ-81 TaxID=2820288 RepID=UPI001ABC3CE3|nr:ABC transporter substrate-binding protein [Streptomyces sp. NEAU-YJ-81]MBO3680481.1 ABC transporter substrate-binding protein [Streptomyces sp. NEAU-YJ-81]
MSSSAASTGAPAVHEIVLEPGSALTGAPGSGSAVVPDRLAGLVEMAGRAGRIAEFELSFFWRADHDGTGDLLFATVRATGPAARTTLSWVEHATVPYGITDRELDVVTLLIGGLSNTQIADRLGTSPRTVSTHVERILAKLDVRTRAAAAALALEESLLVLPVPGGTEGFEKLLMGMVGSSAPATGLPATARPGVRNGVVRCGPGRTGPLLGKRRSIRRPILLGGAFPVTGQIAEDGREMLRASQLAIDEINRHGGVAGTPVELVSVDLDIKDAASIARAFQYLAGQDVDAMVSGYLGDQEVAHEIAADHGAPYLHAATLDSMTRLVEDNPGRYGNVFQICPSDTCYGPGFVDAMSCLRNNRQVPVRSRSLAIVRGRWKFGDLGITAAAELAERQGWRLDYVADDIVGERAWREQGHRIAQLAPAAVMIGSYFADEAIPFVRGFLTNPSPTVLYALYAPSIPRFRVEIGSLAEGLLWATTTGTYSDPVAHRFTDRYRSAWAVSPGRSHAGIAYDRVRILAGAWAASDSPRDFASVTEALREWVHRGVNGTYSFAGAGQSTLAYPLTTSDPSLAMAHLVFQIQDNRQRIVYPAPYTEARFRLPPWWQD